MQQDGWQPQTSLSRLGGVADAEAVFRGETRMRRTESDERINRVSAVLQTELERSPALVRIFCVRSTNCCYVCSRTLQVNLWLRCCWCVAPYPGACLAFTDLLFSSRSVKLLFSSSHCELRRRTLC